MESINAPDIYQSDEGIDLDAESMVKPNQSGIRVTIDSICSTPLSELDKWDEYYIPPIGQEASGMDRNKNDWKLCSVIRSTKYKLNARQNSGVELIRSRSYRSDSILNG